jgi:hypothetical protein
MGLAASQARFLGITARKSNIEYEGQQVNQQRTALAEEVNALYSKLLALELPVAPDTTKFYESNYSFEVTNSAETQGDYLIKSYYQNDNGLYNITAERTYKKETAKGTEYKNVAFSGTTDPATGVESKPWKKISLNGKEYELQIVSDNTSMATLINEAYPEQQVQPNPDDGKYYFYSYADEQGVRHFIDMNQADTYDKTQYPSGITISDYISAQGTSSEMKTFYDAQVTFDSNNRMSNISIPDVTTNAAVNTTRTYDTEGYDAALRDYTMSKDEYDKMVADLNAQTESLQQEDKVLELRLNQIDTEQNELQTELEAVKAVLDKNIENTFKTFA